MRYVATIMRARALLPAVGEGGNQGYGRVGDRKEHHATEERRDELVPKDHSLSGCPIDVFHVGDDQDFC